MKPISRLVSAALLTAVIAAPATSAAQAASTDGQGPAGEAGPAEAEEVPRRFPASSARWKLVTGGVGLTAAAWGVGALCAAAWPEVPGSDALYVPVAGPFVALGQSGCAEDDPGCGAILGVRGVLYVLSGLIQAGGLAVAGEGIFMTTEAPPATSAAAEPRARAVTIVPVPVVTERQAGLGVLGSF